jgi:adenylate cyclase
MARRDSPAGRTVQPASVGNFARDKPARLRHDRPRANPGRNGPHACAAMINRLRLATGLFLFVFLVSHLANHSLGILGSGALEAGLHVFAVVWANLPMVTALTAAFAVHLGLALWSLGRRRTLRMPPAEAAQMILGFAIPLLVIEHAVFTIGAPRAWGVEMSYAIVQLGLWELAPWQGVLQLVLIIVAWVHGVIGLAFWLRLKPWYGVVRPYLAAAAIGLPVLAIAGTVASGLELARDTSRQEAFAVFAEAGVTPQVATWVGQWTNVTLIAFGGLVGLALSARGVRWLVEHRSRRPKLRYPGGRIIEVEPGATVLETSRQAGIPHASVCGGRGRCSTCRIRIGAGHDQVPPQGEREQRVLDRIGAPDRVRLACQLVPTADLEVTPLLPAEVDASEVRRARALYQGQERTIVVMFADLRGFTTLSDQRLPFDTVFLLNRYFEAMGKAIDRAGGVLDKFIGDGIMALFGLDSDPDEAARSAVAAVRGMAEALDHLNEELAADLPSPLRMAIGIHAGPAIIGDMGWGRAKGLTAVGDTVNTASRLEGLAKERDVMLVISDRATMLADIDATGWPLEEADVRGKAATVRVHAIADPREVAA